MEMTAASTWRGALEAWAIPQAILEVAETSPWIHPPVLFDLPDTIDDSPSHDRAREALGADRSLCDVGCGGGIATFALADALRRAVGVDHQRAMCELYEANARRRGLEVVTVEGDFPEVADHVVHCEVVAAHHVAYNVPDLAPFLVALDRCATRRVVLELPERHPLATLASAWKHFWNLDRPDGPTPDDLAAVAREVGFEPVVEHFDGPLRVERDLDHAATFTRIRLCLPESRTAEVRAFLEAEPTPSVRPLATVWWDVQH